MSNRFKGWLIAIGFSTVAWAAIVNVAKAADEYPTITYMLNNPKDYFPAPCDHNKKVCVLTALGGIVDVWVRHVDEHKGYTFIVRGLCASACEIAAKKAKAKREIGSKLKPHKPKKSVWGN